MLPPLLRVSIGGLVAIGAIAAVAVLATSGTGKSGSVVPSAQAATAKARPTVSFTSPKAGVTASGSIKVSAKVSGSPRITRVEFRVDGKLRWTDRKAPFVMNGDNGRLATSNLSNGTHTLTVTAVAANGTRRSATRSFRVRRTGGTTPVGSGSGGGTTTTPPPPSAPAPSSAGAPGSLRLVGVSGSGLAVQWNGASGAASYGVYLNGQKYSDAVNTGYTFNALSCGISYRITVDSAAANGSRSERATIVGTTNACPPASVFLSPSGNDANNCSAQAPCRTLDRGYKAAAPGALVQLAGGSYPGGTIGYDPAKNGAGARVTMAPAPGQPVSVTGELMVSAQHLELRDMTMAGGWQTDASAADVLMRNLDSVHLFINSSQQVSVIGGRIGPFNGAPLSYHPQIAASTATPPRDILIDGVTFHDWRVASAGQHTECLQIGGGDRITVRNSRFVNCEATGNMHITHYGPPSPVTRNVTIENNFFSTTINGYYSIQAYAVQNLLIRNNSATQAILVMPFSGDTVAGKNVRLVANLAPQASYGCVSGVSYRSNVFFWGVSGQSAAKCDSSDTALTGVSNPGFVNPGALDLHLTGSSPALGKGAATEAAVTDIDGEPRGASPDAGADER